MGTLSEEIISRKSANDVMAGDTVIVDVDFVLSHDTTTPLAIKAPDLIADPLPMLYGFDETITLLSMQTSLVPSVEPSSITIISALGCSFLISGSNTAKPISSFFAGIMIDKSWTVMTCDIYSR